MKLADLYREAAIAEGYESVPVDIETFLTDPFYLGNTFGPNEDGTPRIYPYWMKALKEVFPNPLYSPYEEICVTGCIGAGKSTFAIMGICYDLYRLTLLKNPHRKWKLLPTTHIVFTLLSATMDLSSVVIADQLIDALGASPYFCRKFCPKKGEKVDEDMFPHHIGINFGSRQRHNLGKAVIGGMLDEANFQDAVANQAVNNYNTIHRRMSSRFMSKGGNLPFRMWLISSRNEDSSFLESHIAANTANPKVKIYAPAIWEVQEFKGIYSGKTFPVFVGSSTEQPMICTTEKDIKDHEGLIIQVPVEYRKDFEDNLPGALMDLAGVANRGSMSLIYNVEKLIAAQTLDNAVSSEEIRLTLDGDDQIIDYLKKDLPPLTYYVHLDGALSGDRFGFAMSAVEKQMKVKDMDMLTGAETSKLSPAIITPIAFGIKALPGSQVPLWKVRKFCLDLRNKGVNIKQITADGFQSADMIQLLTKMGFNTKKKSVDLSKDAYLMLSSNIAHGLIKIPNGKILDTELRNLQNGATKVDHPDTVVVDGKTIKGGKDIADAVAGSSHEAVLGAISLTASAITDAAAQMGPRSMKQRQEYVQSLIMGSMR